MRDMPKRSRAPKGKDTPTVTDDAPAADGLVYCEGVSISTGKRCRRRVTAAQRFCGRHTPTAIEEGPAHRCTAWSRTAGERCRQPAIPGGTVCRFHGGGNPDVKRKAALRLAALVDPAIATLGREMVKADRSSDRQRAANSILDRAGISRAASAEVEVARSLLLERLAALRADATGVPEIVLDAEVVE